MEKREVECIYCNKKVKALIETFIYRCEKCGELWGIGDLETIYECTSYTCGDLFSRSETTFPANQCPYCGWPYGRKYADHVCPKCWKERHIVSECKAGYVVLCLECGKRFFTDSL